jgi:glycosyltransferase involved in cell wall biosynthesis
VVNIPKAELAAKLRNSDIYLSNSTEREGFGLPAIEAAASGLLCILSDITAYRSFSSRDDYCIFVPEGDSDATVSALERIYNMPGPEFRKMRNNSIEVASEFSHNEACSRFENILMEISREK